MRDRVCEGKEGLINFEARATSTLSIGFKKKILARLEGGIRVRRAGQYAVEGSDR
jgi:hypothetical protein